MIYSQAAKLYPLIYLHTTASQWSTPEVWGGVCFGHQLSSRTLQLHLLVPAHSGTSQAQESCSSSRHPDCVQKARSRSKRILIQEENNLIFVKNSCHRYCTNSRFKDTEMKAQRRQNNSSKVTELEQANTYKHKPCDTAACTAGHTHHQHGGASKAEAKPHSLCRSCLSA